MKTDWAVIVPFSKPGMLETTLANARRQHDAGESIRLVLVKNGPALSLVVPKNEPFEIIELESAAHQSSARNTGLDFVTANRLSDRIAMFDCDDYYGPGYLVEQRSFMQPGRLVGKGMHFVDDEEGLFLINADWKGGFSSELCGSTPCFFTDDATLRYPFLRVGEDTLFHYEWANTSGRECYATSPYGYCYHRGHQNTWKTNLRQRLARSGFRIVSLGRFDPGIVNGEKPWDSGKALQDKRFSKALPL